MGKSIISHIQIAKISQRFHAVHVRFSHMLVRNVRILFTSDAEIMDQTVLIAGQSGLILLLFSIVGLA